MKEFFFNSKYQHHILVIFINTTMHLNINMPHNRCPYHTTHKWNAYGFLLCSNRSLFMYFQLVFTISTLLWLSLMELIDVGLDFLFKYFWFWLHLYIKNLLILCVLIKKNFWFITHSVLSKWNKSWPLLLFLPTSVYNT